MRTVLLRALLACLPAFSAFSQTVSHPLIEQVKVLYKPVPASPGNPQPASSIVVRASVLVSLKQEQDGLKIYLNMKDKESQASLYEAVYTIASPDIKEQGLVVYHKTGLLLSLLNPAVLVLKPYVYELCTEDAAGHKSALYTIIQ